MKTKRCIIFILFLLIILVIGSLIGCSLIGYGVGSLFNKPDFITVTTWQIQTIDKGSMVEIYRKHGTVIEGVYQGLNSLGIDEYARLFTQNGPMWPSETHIPDLKDTFTVVLKSGMRRTCDLIGYDFGTLWVREISLKYPHSYAYQRISAVEYKGSTYSIDSLENVLSSLEVPLLSSMLVETRSGVQTVSFNDIQLIMIQRSSISPSTIGFLAGLAVDVVVVVSATSQSGSSSSSSKQGGGSCPFIYSYDSLNYILDAEVFSGSIMKALQRTNIVNLEHLLEVNGTYKLKLTDDLPETEYVDDLKLLVVDHPKGTKVIPTFDGRFCSLSNLQKPLFARDYRNNNVLQMVAFNDDVCWVSNPLGRNPNQKSDVRDGIELSFTLPRDKYSAKLVFNIQNTPWATEIEAQLLRLKGRELGEWYDAVNNSKSYLNSFVDGVKREAMLEVSLWTGQSWKPIDYIWFVGPHVSRTQVLEFSLEKLPPNELRVRLESTAGLWMINSINADFTSEAPMNVTEISLDKAIDNFGHDVKTLLDTVDNQYYVLNNAGDEADLTFKAPPRVSSMDRSLMLKSTGYYTIHVLADGEPQNALVKWIGNEPRAFGSYSLQLLNNYISPRIADMNKTNTFQKEEK